MDAPGGQTWNYWLYPALGRVPSNHRKRTLCWMEPTQAGRPLRVVDEYGQVFEFERDRWLYERFRAFVTERRTVYVRRLDFGVVVDVIGIGAIKDKQHANVVYSPKTGFRGFRFRMGNGFGALLSTGVWYPDLFEPHDFVFSLRAALDLLDIGDYDTAGALGQATLERYWSNHDLRRSWRLAGDLTTTLIRYGVGGRAEVRGVPGMIYPTATEYDLKSAYPTAVARGIPMGRPCYHGRTEPTGFEAAFLVCRVRVHDDIDYSPIPFREWGVENSGMRWRLYAGEEFTYAGWKEEFAALRATGKATIDFLHGWSWSRLDSSLAGWVDEMVVARVRAGVLRGDHASKIIKVATNAAIGRWGMAPEQWILWADGERQYTMDTLILNNGDNMASREGMQLTIGLYAERVKSEPKTACPYHWSSYVRMVVRMQLYRVTKAKMEAGRVLLSSNFDSSTFEGEDLQATDSLEVAHEQGKHPFRLVPKVLHGLEMPYNRASISDEEARLPGISPAMRMAQLVDHERRRRAASAKATDQDEQAAHRAVPGEGVGER